jgi:putative hydrolase of the HAD superfamily
VPVLPGRPLAPGSLAGRADAVLLDVDHTLVDTSSAFGTALLAALRDLLPEAAAARPEPLLDLWHHDASGHYRRYTRGEIGYHDQRRARVDELLAAAGTDPLSAAGYEAFSTVYDARFARAWAPFPDATDAVRSFARAGLRLGAVTNAHRAVQERKLAATGFAELVPILVTLETHGVGKPDPRVWLTACELLGVDPARTVYVGDEPDVDARAAAEAGLLGVWVRRDGDERFADWSLVEPGTPGQGPAIGVVSDLTALRGALEWTVPEGAG